jgi:hypothetical protein
MRHDPHSGPASLGAAQKIETTPPTPVYQTVHGIGYRFPVKS